MIKDLAEAEKFWSSDILTGSQTERHRDDALLAFWSSDILTGSQTPSSCPCIPGGFGAVTF